MLRRGLSEKHALARKKHFDGGVTIPAIGYASHVFLDVSNPVRATTRPLSLVFLCYRRKTTRPRKRAYDTDEEEDAENKRSDDNRRR